MQSNNDNIQETEANILCQTKHEVNTKEKGICEDVPTMVNNRLSNTGSENLTYNESVYHEAKKLPPITYTEYFMRKYRNEAPVRTHGYSSYGRMRPYYIPHRTRTKSESSDPSNLSLLREGLLYGNLNTPSTTPSSSTMSSVMMETCEPTGAMMDISMNTSGTSGVRLKTPVVLLKKSSSLENIRVVDNSFERSQNSHEMEFVSSRIQKLKVQE